MSEAILDVLLLSAVVVWVAMLFDYVVDGILRLCDWLSRD